MGEQSIQPCTDGSACEQHVVHQDHIPAFYGEPHVIDVGAEQLVVGANVVSEKGDIQSTARHLAFGLQFVQPALQSLRKSTSSRLQTNQNSLRKIMVFDQLVCQAIEDERKLRWRNQGLIQHF
jgi:hypothetical protein